MVRCKQLHLEIFAPSAGPVPHGQCPSPNHSQHVGWPDGRVSVFAGKRYSEKGNLKPYLFCTVRPHWEHHVWFQTCLLTVSSPQILVAELWKSKMWVRVRCWPSGLGPRYSACGSRLSFPGHSSFLCSDLSWVCSPHTPKVTC